MFASLIVVQPRHPDKLHPLDSNHTLKGKAEVVLDWSVVCVAGLIMRFICTKRTGDE
jgi:hypothetical protein